MKRRLVISLSHLKGIRTHAGNRSSPRWKGFGGRAASWMTVGERDAAGAGTLPFTGCLPLTWWRGTLSSSTGTKAVDNDTGTHPDTPTHANIHHTHTHTYKKNHVCNIHVHEYKHTQACHTYTLHTHRFKLIPFTRTPYLQSHTLLNYKDWHKHLP